MNDQESEESEEEGFGYDEEEEEVGEEISTEGEEGGTGAGQREARVRGRDLAWIKIHEYETTLEYLSSDIFKELANGNYSLRKSRETNYGDRETHECKFSRKRGFLPCKLKYRVTIDNASEKVRIEKCGRSHSHEKDPTIETTENPHYFKWTEEQTQIVIQGCKNNLDPTNIRSNLRDSNLCLVVFPTVKQLNNKIQFCRRKLFTKDIVMTGELREAIAKMIDMPVDDTQAYVVNYEVVDDQEDGEVRFVVTWSTKKMRARINVDLVQDDATYR